MSNDELDDYDLTAWEAPAPPDDLATVVLARLQGTAVDVALPVEPAQVRRRWLIIGGIAAGVVAATGGVWALVHGAHHAEPQSGAVVAQRPQRVELPGADVMLDPGADVKWHPARDGMHAEQRAGAATWTVSDKLVIDAGAAVASVEAQGASLRVEVHMNRTDVRVVGASALTSAAVALVTVVVYQGHVQVTGGGHSMVVAPGTTVEIEPGEPPKEEVAVGAAPKPDDDDEGSVDVVVASGESATIHDAGDRTSVKIDVDAPCGNNAKIELTGHGANAVATEIWILQPGTYQYAVQCKALLVATGQLVVTHDQSGPVQLRTPADGGAWDDLVDISGTAVPGSRIMQGQAPIEIENGRFSEQRRLDSKDVLLLRAIHPEQGLHFYVRRSAALKPPAMTAEQQTEIVLGTVCDAARTARKWQDLRACANKLMATSPAPAKILADLAVKEQRAEVALDKLKDAVENSDLTSARKQLDAIPADSVYRQEASTLFGDAQRRNFDFDAKCDADELMNAGEQSYEIGQYGVALKKFEAAVQCKGDVRAVQKAFMAACQAQSLTTARKYWLQLSEVDRDRLVQICARAGYRRTQLDASLPPSSCDADASSLQGDEDVSTGQYGIGMKEYEESYQCRADPKTLRKIFMAACGGSNITAVAVYWPKLPAADQRQLKQICIRNNIDPDKLGGGSTTVATTGRLKVMCSLAAKIMIDGVDTGQTTPASLDLAPGKHKVTFKLGEDRFTYPVTVIAGQTVALSKDLH